MKISAVSKLFILCFFYCFTALGQTQQYSLQDLENSFFENNVQLLAQKLNIQKAHALAVYQKVWQNPNFSISEVNLWKTYNIEKQAHLFGNYGEAQQIALELEQLIETAGKRKKRVAVKNQELQGATLQYEELLRELKKELRIAYFSLNSIIQQENSLKQVVQLFEELSAQYKKQNESQNVSQADYLRVEAELIALQKDLVNLNINRQEQLRILQVLTHNTDLKAEQILFSNKPIGSLTKIPLDIKQIALKQNIQLQLLQNEVQIASAQLKVERANSKPDLTLKLNYDRGGSIMSDFIGFGVGMDIPIFNKNKGQIKAAEYTLQQQSLQVKDNELKLCSYIGSLQKQLVYLDQTLKRWPLKQLNTQSQVLESYKKNLQSKQISLIEFIDFNSSYLESFQAYTELLESYNSVYEELQYITGQDF